MKVFKTGARNEFPFNHQGKKGSIFEKPSPVQKFDHGLSGEAEGTPPLGPVGEPMFAVPRSNHMLYLVGTVIPS